MFDNPEKLMILLVIALMIFGPSRLAGFGSTMGRAIRDLRSAMRGAQDEARSVFSEFTQEASEATHEVQQALAAPDPVEAAPFMSSTGEPEVVEHDGEAPVVPSEAPRADAAAAFHEDPSSLASEPTAAALREVTRQAQHTTG